MASIVKRADGNIYIKIKVGGKWKQKYVGWGDEAMSMAKDMLLAPPPKTKDKLKTARTVKIKAPTVVIGKGNKTKSDTTAGQVETIISAVQPLLHPPSHVVISHEARPFWDSIVIARARNTWNDSDLEQAAILAKIKCDIERLCHEISVEGDMIDLGLRGMVINPKHDLIDRLSRRCLAISRALHIDATATQGRSRDTGEKTKREQDMRDKFPKEDDLISRPSVVQ